MTRGAYHSCTTPDGDIVRKDGGPDGRFLKRKERVTPYYVRLDFNTFNCLESLLDVQQNRDAGTAIAGIACRADLIERSLSVFLRIHGLAREMNIRETDLVSRMIDAVRFQSSSTDFPISLDAKPPTALPAPRNSNA